MKLNFRVIRLAIHEDKPFPETIPITDSLLINDQNIQYKKDLRLKIICLSIFQLYIYAKKVRLSIICISETNVVLVIADALTYQDYISYDGMFEEPIQFYHVIFYYI